MTQHIERQLLYFHSLCEIIQIWGYEEIGNVEVDIEKVASYLDSVKFIADSFDYNKNTYKEDMQKDIINKIIEGFPVWEYLKISDWTKSMISKSFEKECIEEFEKLKEEYKCFTCKYYSIKKVSLGSLEKCNSKEKNNRFKFSRERFELQKECFYYDSAPPKID